MSVTITEKAVLEVKKVMESQNLDPATQVLRLAVTSGGCSGFNYGISFAAPETIKEDDIKFESFGLNIVVDPKSEILLDETTVDFHDGLEARGFTFKNPGAERTCGCGNSFCPK